MIVLIALPTLLIYVVAIGLTVRSLHEQALRELKQETERQASNLAARFDGAFRQAAAFARSTARFMESHPEISERQIFDQLRANTLLEPEIYGAAMAFEPGRYLRDNSLYCPYVYRGPEGIVEMNITRDVLDWYGEERWQWWSVPKRTGGEVWTDPYFDEGAGNVLMVTYSAPFRKENELWGVTTVDIMLPTLEESIGRDILTDVEFFIVTQTGDFVFSPNKSDIMIRSIFDIADDLEREDIKAAGERIVSGDTGVVSIDAWMTPEGEPLRARGSRQWAFYAPIESTGWSFVALAPEDEIVADVRTMTTQASIAFGATLVLIVGSIYFVSGRLSRPIQALRSKVNQIAEGDLDARVDHVGARDEIGELAESFNRMTADLRANLDRLANERGAREKMERDLDLAREIQIGLLPKHLPKADGFDIAAWNKPADQTGGDYYDWLDLHDGRTLITLADVTGHGIAPALIVAVCRAYMRAAASTEHESLSNALSRVNGLLQADIPADRFVTAVVGVLDPAGDSMAMVSAGHGPLLFYRAKTGKVESWSADHIPLGVLDNIEFPDPRIINFEHGDLLLLLTDGFFEWADPDGEFYGTERLDSFIRKNHTMNSAEFIQSLHAEVLEHARGTTQADDLTAIVIRKL